MGAGEESSPAKTSIPAPTQETPPPSYADWSNSMQAYYGAGGTPPFFASTVASPTPHPYMWGGQHPMMSPYGTAVPYPAMYPPAGVYAHPSMPMTPGSVAEMEGKSNQGKERSRNKKAKGNGVRTGESGKAASSSGNDGATAGTQSGESGSDGSSDASDQNEYSDGKKGSFNQMLADANAQNGGGNIESLGMDLWNPSGGSGTMKMRPNPTPPVMGMPVQDERELKRQKRKQSNRESARRSRLRKQAECEELQARVEALSNENHSLREELQRLSQECDNLTSQNNSIKDELTRVCGPSNLDQGNT